MARADVGVVGAGLAGLLTAIELADAGATVRVLAAGHAATHWTPATVDLGFLTGVRTPAAAVAQLAGRAGHPYLHLGAVLPDALRSLRAILAESGLALVGEPDDPVATIPTAIGSTRPAAIVPDAMAAALRPWAGDETLVVLGIAGFRDYWAEAIAASLREPSAWRGHQLPGRIEAIDVDLPGLVGRHNLSGLHLARAFDDPAWRDDALDRLALALDGLAVGRGRVALPAVLGLHDHPAVLAAARDRLPLDPFEVALVPPSVPGLRQFHALRDALRRRGGRIQIGAEVRGELDGRRVTELSSPAAARRFRLSVESVVLATGGIAGGGIVGRQDGGLTEQVLGLPIQAPPADDWLAIDPFDPAGHPLEAAGVLTDAQLRPIEAGGDVLVDNVRIVGSLLAGQRYLREWCGDGVAIASARLVGRDLGGSVPESVSLLVSVKGPAS